MARRGSTRSGGKAEREFVSEAEEILERMLEDLADLGDQRAAGGEVDPELVNRLFRSAHSLKGLAGLFGFEPVQALAHRLEDVLDALRLGRIGLDAPAVTLIDRVVAQFGTLLEAVGDPEALAATEAAVGDLVSQIDLAREAPVADAQDLSGLGLDPSLLRALTEYEEHRLRENLRRGRHILLVEASFEIVSFEEGLSELTTCVRDAGEVLSTLPSPGDSSEAQIRFSLLVASDASAEQVSQRISLPDAEVRCVRTGSASAPQPAEPSAASRRGGETETESLKSLSETVRVDIHKLDQLMNLVGELVIQRSALGDLISGLRSDSQTARVGNDLAKVHKVLERKLRELQSAVLEVRMVPLRQVFEKVSRVVRRLRIELAKDVRLELRGADTELDKLIVEELVDPLMHIVRNALDHAIEAPAERVEAGKPEQACLRIEAFQRGNHVVIAVADDGRGIDTEGLRQRAEQRGIVAPGETLGEKETLELIFAPGISTCSEVTETSGRGVGMDVVRHNLTQLGGVVEVESRPGRGTTVSLTLPITLAIVQSLVVAVGNQRFAIPLSAVHETLLIDASDVQRSEGRELLNVRGDALPLRRLAREFEIPEAPDAKPFVVVVGMGDSRMGLVVDRLDGQQDTVIKPIQGPIRAVRGIAGATELGDLDPVLVLDVSALLADALGRREAA